eukprot:gene4337-111_t
MCSVANHVHYVLYIQGAVDFLPTVMSIAGVQVPASTLLRGHDISDIWHGKLSDQTVRPKALLWRGGGGPPPCWNRSPGLAARNGEWKLLFNGDGSREELYNMNITKQFSGVQANGGFFESQDHSGANPDIVSQLKAEAMAWHQTTSCPFGAAPGTCKAPSVPGCEAYAFPGMKKHDSLEDLAEETPPEMQAVFAEPADL